MPSFYPYNPEQAYLLPPSVRDVLSENHLCFFVSRSVERLDLSAFERGYSEQGHPAYHPALMLKVWLYAYALGLTSSRRLEQRVREDLALRYLAGGAQPDFWALNEFRKRHGRALNDVFTQVLEAARSMGMGKLGHVAIDSTPLAANASMGRMETETKLRAERAKIRRRIRTWQQRCDSEDPNEAPGTALANQEMKRFQERLAEIPKRLQRLRKAGVKRLSKTDEDSRVMRDRRGFTVGYNVTVAVSEDHVIVAQQVGQERAANGLLVPMTDAVQRECGERPPCVLADAGFFSVENLEKLLERGIDAYVPDSHMARELSRGIRVRGHAAALQPAHRRMRQKLRSPAGQAIYHRRKHIVEPVFGVLKEQRGMRRFRYRGLAKVAIEFTLAALAYNLTRMWNRKVRV
jgi:transposase/IS5 family transposase